MTLPDEVNPLHSSYMELSARYKAAWTYHRFVEGLRKFFGNRDVAEYPVDFQTLYRRLKEVSQNLNDPDHQRQLESLNTINDELALMIAVLERDDRKISPTHLRLFFQRIKNQDERILIDLVRFYQEIQADSTWEEDRVDKVDFLLTRLGEKVAGSSQSGDHHRLNKIMEGISANYRVPANLDPQKLANRQKMIRAVRGEIHQVEDLDELTDRDLVAHYRRVKHGLGNLLFEHSILTLVVETNLVVASRVRELSALEEEKLLADYERVSELEEGGKLDRRLAEAVGSLHHEVGEFQKQLRSGNVRLLNLLAMRNSVHETLAQIEGVDQGQLAELPLDAGLLAGDNVRSSVDRMLTTAEEHGLVSEYLAELLTGLIESEDPDVPEGSGSGGASSQLIPFRLEDRETQAFTKLRSGEECNERIECFLLAAAALRRKVNREVEEIHAYRSSNAADESPLSTHAESLLRLADWYLHQFSHQRETLLLTGDLEGSAELQRLQMRLMRDYAGLWLVAHPSSG